MIINSAGIAFFANPAGFTPDQIGWRLLRYLFNY